MKRRILLVLAALVAGVTGGCKSDEATICERLDDCKLFPSSTSPQEPNGLTEKNCEYQVENELSSSDRDRCANCVGGHACGEIRAACKDVCNPPY